MAASTLPMSIIIVGRLSILLYKFNEPKCTHDKTDFNIKLIPAACSGIFHLEMMKKGMNVV